jgi:hypothetical protein
MTGHLSPDGTWTPIFHLGYVWIGGEWWNGMEWDGMEPHSIVWFCKKGMEWNGV